MTQTQQPTTVAGLRLVRLVGRGGEGDVWEACTPTGARRAVKLVRPEAVAPPDQVELRGHWLRRIDHPALVRVRRTGMLADAPWQGWGLVEMDFVDGADLSAPHPRPDALRRLAGLAEGLDLLHAGRWSAGTPLVHRDVKPANLIDAPDGRIVLVDNSSLCGVDRTMLTRIGTPVFAAPEVLTGRIGPASDVYSFAATVVALRTGARGEALLAHLDQPSSLDLPVPLARALDADPTRRPASCAALLRRERAAAVDGWLPAHVAGRAEDGRVPAGERTRATADRTTPAGAVPDATTAASDAGPHRVMPDGVMPDGAMPDGAVPDGTVPHGTIRAHGGATGPTDPDALDDDLPVVSGAGGVAEAADMVPAPPPRSVWPFLVLLGGVAGLLGGAALRPETLGVPWIVTGLALSVVAHVAAERSVWGALLLPPVAWAGLLAHRATTVVSRRDWLRATATGVLGAATMMAVEALRQVGAQASTRLLVVTVALGYLLTGTAVVVARRDAGSVAIRIALAPATLLGSVVLLAVALILVPVDAVTGARSGIRRRAGSAVRALGAVAAFGPSSAGPHRFDDARAPDARTPDDTPPSGGADPGPSDAGPAADPADRTTTWRGARA